MANVAIYEIPKPWEGHGKRMENHSGVQMK